MPLAVIKDEMSGMSSSNRGERNGEPTEGVGTSTGQRDLPVSPSDVWEALVAIQEARIRREADRMASEMAVGQMFRRQAVNAGTQVRPSHLDNQIFMARIFSEARGTSDDDPQPSVSSAPVHRRNMSVNTAEFGEITEGHEEWPLRKKNIRLGSGRRRLLMLSRYASLYRRSLVGQYDRTSILRKPIYSSKVNRYKSNIFYRDFKLNTNYEINETQRLQREDKMSCEPTGSSRELPSSSGIHSRKVPTSCTQGRTTAGLRKSRSRIGRLRKLPSSSFSAQRTAISSLTQELTRSLGSNLNSLRESLPVLQDRINSTCESLRRGENILQSIDELIGDDEPLDGDVEEPSRVINGERTSSTGISSSEDGPGVAVTENSVREPRRTEGTTGLSPAGSSTTNGERTILMGVFRAGNEDGIRGTSMRRHNIAAVTVSSASEISPSTAVDRLSSERNRTENESKSQYNFKRDAKHSSHRSSLVPINKKIHQNTKRLTHYVEEPNLGRGNDFDWAKVGNQGKGLKERRKSKTDFLEQSRANNRLYVFAGVTISFIKELCVSPDGRIVCSPFGNGIRLLSFSPRVQDVFHCYPTEPPVPLHELTLNVAHTDIVVCTKFSPFHNILVSGCLAGKIVYYQPFL